MVIVHLSGGFGNQLFSYAFGYAVAKIRNDRFCIDSAIQDADWFFRNPDILKMNITYDKRITYPIRRKIWDRALFNKINFQKNIGWGTKILTEEVLRQEERPLEFCKNIKADIYLKGNWESESWFSNVADEIREMYVFKEPLSDSAMKIYDEICGCPDAVTIHVRRGDYVGIGVALEPDYYIRAMEEIAKQVKTPEFYCFSEDMEWVKEAFRQVSFKMHYPEYKSEDKGVEDFRLLTAGKHQIISNSTYSWWAAYLNRNAEKKVVVPCREDSGWNSEFAQKEWIPLSFTMNGKQKG